MHTQKRIVDSEIHEQPQKTHHFFMKHRLIPKQSAVTAKQLLVTPKQSAAYFYRHQKKRNKLLSILVWMLTPKINRSHQIPIDDVIQNERSRSASTIHKLDYFYKIVIINIYYDWSRQAMVKWLKRACAVLLLKSITIVRSILEIA